MGIDVGINCLAVASTTDKKCKFFAGGEIKDHRNVLSKERRRLQKAGGRYLGTRSSMRVLRYFADCSPALKGGFLWIGCRKRGVILSRIVTLGNNLEKVYRSCYR
jgi:hypothetical protein